MKMTKIALIVAGMCAASAYAQDAGFKTNLYGILDVAYATATNQATGVSTGRIISGGDAPSIFGIAGGKDLGNGMKVALTYEGNASTADGSTTLFTRSANFAITGSMGTVRAGRQYDPAFLAYAATDPRGAAMNNSGLQYWIAGAASTGVNTTSTVNIFTSNTVSWTNTFGGLTPTIAFGSGNSGTAGNNAGNVTSLGLVYDAGALKVSGGTVTNTQAAATGADSTGTSFGAAYTMGKLLVALNTLNFKTSTSTVDLTTTGVGGTYDLGGGLTANLAYYANKDNKAGGSQNNTTFGVSYALDKQVTMYGQVGNLVTDSTGYNGGGSPDSSSGFAGVAGKTVQTMFLGTRVSF